MTEPMSKRVPQLLVALVALFGAVAIAVVVLGNRSDSSDPDPNSPIEIGEQLDPEEEAVRSAQRFLDAYVGLDGRVERDEGDTVSEGQAYALLISVALHDETTFDRVWQWTRDNLLTESGTLAWKWSNSRIIDPNAATDADLDVARALFMASERFERPDFGDAALDLADALVDEDVVTAGDTSVLVAGPWATTAPYAWNPSYLAPASFDLLATETGDPMWTGLREDALRLLDDVTDAGTLLPSDWARLDSDGNPDTSGAPGGSDRPTYGFDAFRTIPRLAEACDAGSRDLAVALGPVVERAAEAEGQILDLNGDPVDGDGSNPLFLLAAASGAEASGDDERANEFADRAERIDAGAPSYYLGAWIALTRLMVDTDRLDVCSRLENP
ncbi:glycosyl hydrolase family 8 [Ilumatobacter nonamiensis]|uniref:glycosyl hydrolase family 8 n=1 Tax=Ilumatobacter nonamiensis TaxID=467093 RepID=UPI00034CED05|nr:glycosyl hydrolase family 8 [Ilumatobacter nonamiensis]